MNYRRSDRVGAFIIRPTKLNGYELLVFRQAHTAQAAIEIPGGGVEPWETLEAALHREILEESGLQNLRIIRKLGTLQRCWLDTHNVACRHYFLLEAPPTTPDAWEHTVQGNGSDAGWRFLYFWTRPPKLMATVGSWIAFLNAELLPELYAIETSTPAEAEL